MIGDLRFWIAIVLFIYAGATVAVTYYTQPDHLPFGCEPKDTNSAGERK